MNSGGPDGLSSLLSATSPSGPPEFMLVDGELPRFEVLDPLHVRFTWDKPNPVVQRRPALDLGLLHQGLDLGLGRVLDVELLQVRPRPRSSPW
jgi:hypothetical protein